MLMDFDKLCNLNSEDPIQVLVEESNGLPATVFSTNEEDSNSPTLRTTEE